MLKLQHESAEDHLCPCEDSTSIEQKQMDDGDLTLRRCGLTDDRGIRSGPRTEVTRGNKETQWEETGIWKNWTYHLHPGKSTSQSLNFPKSRRPLKAIDCLCKITDNRTMDTTNPISNSEYPTPKTTLPKKRSMWLTTKDQSLVMSPLQEIGHLQANGRCKAAFS